MSPPFPRDLRTEIYLDGWTDVSEFVRQTSTVTVTRGRTSEAIAPQPGVAKFTLDDTAGDFAPRNPLGQWYGLLSRNTPVRLSLGMVADTFTRTVGAGWSSADTGDAWTFANIGSSSVTSGTGRHSGQTAGSNGLSYLAGLVLADGEVAVTVTLPGIADITGGALEPTLVLHGQDLSNYYMVRLVLNADETVALQLYSRSAGTDTSLVGPLTVAGLTWASGRAIRIKAHIDGGTIRAKAWDAAVLEPFDWLIENTRVAPHPPGWVGVRSGRSAGNSNTTPVFAYDEFEVRSGRFHGELSDLSPDWNENHADRTVPVTAGGTLRRLAQRSQPELSTLKRGYLFDTVNTPVQYWPCEEDRDAAVISSAFPGAPPMLLFGTLQLGANSAFACSQPIPTMAADTAFVGNVPGYSVTGQLQVRFLLSVPPAGATDQTLIATIPTSGNLQWSLFYATGGGIHITAVRDDGSSALSSTIGFGLNGFLGLISLELTQNGTGVDWDLASLAVGASSGGVTGATVATATVGLATTVYVNAAQMSIGHITVQKAVDSLFDLATQLKAYAGEFAGDRFVRLCAEASIPSQVIAAPAESAAMGPQRPNTISALLGECATTDLAELYESAYSPALVLRPHRTMTTQAAALVLDYAGGDVYTPLSPVDDDQGLANDVTAKQAVGSEYRTTLDSGPLGTPAPPDGVGRYDTTVTVNVASERQLPDVAGWLLHEGTTDQARYPTIRATLRAAGLDQVAALDVGIGDRVDITNLSDALIYDDVVQIVRGYSEQLTTAYAHDLSWSCQPGEPWRVGVLDDASYGHLDSDAATLGSSATSTATSLSVATSAGHALWTTASADWPFAIAVGGEVMTVTAVAGASSPQTFTVTRSVNGVVKAHAAGERVGLAHPVYVGK